MNHENILQLAFFNTETGAVINNHRATYKEACDHIVEYAHSALHWSERHTGLTILVGELTIIIEIGLSTIIPYAKGLLKIIESLLRKLELSVNFDKNMEKSPSDTANPDEKGEEAFTFTEFKLFTEPANHLCELITLVLKAVYPKGCTTAQKQYIVKGMYLLLGWEYTGKKWQNSVDAVRKRTPPGVRLTYYLDKIVDKVNDEFAA